ncbi:MAG TPA: hypothetical protein VNI84_05290 [Pyrinomonadaceae bacterium]|nr:hypothetical protein [Pyrinomonadaceae bacterium]
METKPAKLKKRRVKKPKTFKRKFSDLFGNRHVENSWEINVLIFLLIVFAAISILLMAMGPMIFEYAPKDNTIEFDGGPKPME